MATLRASYPAGVDWIAFNDEPEDIDVDNVAGYISTSLLAELFGKDAAKVAADIVQRRVETGLTDASVYVLPPRFYDDHRSRDLPESGVSVLLRRTYHHVHVVMDDAAATELLSDARHYASEMGEWGFEGRGIMRSAAATVRALEADGVH